VSRTFERRFQIYTQLLRSTRGLFNAHLDISPATWDAFASALSDWPVHSLTGIGWAPRVPRPKLSEFVAQEQRVNREDFAIHGEGTDPIAYPVQYAHPANLAHVFTGLDLSGIPSFTTTLTTAVATGQDAVTDQLQTGSRAGSVLLVMPIYESGIQPGNPHDRLGTMAGVVFTLIEVPRLLNNVVSITTEISGLEVYDGAPSPQSLLASTATKFESTGPRIDVPCAIGGRPWTLRVTYASNTPGWVRTVPWLLAGCTLGLGLLGLLLRYQFQNRQQRARRLAERMTADLRNAQVDLSRTLAQAKEAAAAKDEFLAVMSHELRTPLNGVIGMTTLLLDSDLDPQQRDFAETSRSCAMGLLEIINDILDYSKLEAGKVALENLPFDPRDLLEEVLQVIADRAHAKNLELVGEVDPRLGERLRGDPSRLRQLLLNLVSNAVKFTERGEIFVTVRLVRDHPQRPLVRVAVRDTGIGVNPDQLKTLFKPFSQADNSISRRFGGTGLGLAISKRLIEAMGGRISVSSAVDQGSEFAAELTLEREDATSSSPFQAELTGRLVLIIDDHDSARSVTASILAECGSDVVAVPDLDEAQAILGEASPELAILDAAGVDDDPTEIARVFRAIPAFTEVPLLLLTSFVRLHPTDQLGIAYSSKPIRRRQVRNLCSTLLGARRHAGTGMFSRRFDGLQVLIADARLGNLRVLSTMLTDLGCRVDMAADSEECIAAAERVAYAAIILAADLPPHGALKIAAELRRHRSTAALVLAGGAEQAAPPGFDAWVPSPPRASHLAGILTRAAKRA
ncbi:MAG: ATP-binding protein, partial [Planctomycetota bacterium]